jgi:hypothetical protein
MELMDALVEEATMAINATMATPIINADAVQDVRAGLSTAFSWASLSVVLCHSEQATDRAGHERAEDGDAEEGDRRAPPTLSGAAW